MKFSIIILILGLATAVFAQEKSKEEVATVDDKDKEPAASAIKDDKDDSAPAEIKEPVKTDKLKPKKTTTVTAEGTTIETLEKEEEKKEGIIARVVSSIRDAAKSVVNHVKDFLGFSEKKPANNGTTVAATTASEDLKTFTVAASKKE